MWEHYGFPLKWSKQARHSSSIKSKLERSSNEFYSRSTVIKDVEETKDTFINNDDLKRDNNYAPGPAVLDKSKVNEESKVG